MPVGDTIVDAVDDALVAAFPADDPRPGVALAFLADSDRMDVHYRKLYRMRESPEQVRSYAERMLAPRGQEQAPPFHDAVDDALVAAFPGDDPMLGAALAFLAASDQMHVHYRKLYRMRESPEQLCSYVEGMLAAAPDDQAQEGPPLKQDEALRLLNECKDRFGTRLKRWEERGIVPVAVVCDLKSTGATLFGGGLPIGLRLAAQQADHLARAAAAANAAGAATASANTFLATRVFPSWGKHIRLAAELSSEKAAACEVLACTAARRASVARSVGQAGLVLQVGLLGYEFHDNIRRYWCGEIDGVACSRNIASSLAGAVGGCFGSAGAVALCAGAGPAGLAFAGLAGGMLAGAAASCGVSQACHKMFGSDRDRAVKHAFQVLGLAPAATHHEIRRKYLELAMAHHPDKGGQKEKFVEINSAYELICAARNATP